MIAPTIAGEEQEQHQRPAPLFQVPPNTDYGVASTLRAVCETLLETV
jgi:hypothetical protein